MALLTVSVFFIIVCISSGVLRSSMFPGVHHCWEMRRGLRCIRWELSNWLWSYFIIHIDREQSLLSLSFLLQPDSLCHWDLPKYFTNGPFFELTFSSLFTAEGLPREDDRRSPEETRPSTRRALSYPAYSSTIHAPVVPPGCRGLSQPQQKEKEYRSGMRIYCYTNNSHTACLSWFMVPLSITYCNVPLPGQLSHPGLHRFPGQSLLPQHQSSVHHLPPKAAFWNPLHKNSTPWQPQTSDRKNPQSQEFQLRTVRKYPFIPYMGL